MGSPFDLVSFVTRAESRVDVLLTLASGPRTRPELQDETGVPRATLSRVLADFRERDLASRNGHRYRPTPLGEVLAADLEALFESVETTRALQSLAGLLPLEELAIDFHRLAEAEVTLPTPVDPMAPVKRAAAIVEGAEHVRTFCYSVVHAPILAALRGVAHRGQRLEGVIAAGVFDVVASDPELAERARELVGSGSVELYRYDEGIEPQLIVADRTTMFLVTDDEGAIQGLVETDDGAILPWAEELFESLRAEAEPLDADSARELLTPRELPGGCG
jgi:predicted transcriptional regulator